MFFFEFKSESPLLQIILIHGFTASPTELKPVAEFLYRASQGKYAIRSILLPGHGVDGKEGYKALDTVSHNDWKTHCLREIEKFSLDYTCPIILVGLSMGALLILYCIEIERYKSKIIGAVLFSPAFFMQGKLFPFLRFIKHFIKYQPKGHKSEEFFEKYHLFSYKVRSVHAVDEFRKLMQETRLMFKNMPEQMIVFLSENDDLVDIKKTIRLIQSKQNVQLEINSSLGHILTVYPESNNIFETMNNWIKNILTVEKNA